MGFQSNVSASEIDENKEIVDEPKQDTNGETETETIVNDPIISDPEVSIQDDIEEEKIPTEFPDSDTKEI